TDAAGRQPQVPKLVEGDHAVLTGGELRQPHAQLGLDVLRPDIGRFTSHPLIEAKPGSRSPPKLPANRARQLALKPWSARPEHDLTQGGLRTYSPCSGPRSSRTAGANRPGSRFPRPAARATASCTA